VTVDHDGVGRYPPEVEAAVYFSVLEAMQNVAKYARASNGVVRLWREHDDLAFSVADDGRGFHKETTPHGMGLQNIADRLAALGGSFDVRSAPGEGTTVLGRVPGNVGPSSVS
jgi:signal transduction histidine kinase